MCSRLTALTTKSTEKQKGRGEKMKGEAADISVKGQYQLIVVASGLPQKDCHLALNQTSTCKRCQLSCYHTAAGSVHMSLNLLLWHH